jgi:hypothetical protein
LILLYSQNNATYITAPAKAGFKAVYYPWIQNLLMIIVSAPRFIKSRAVSFPVIAATILTSLNGNA